MQNKHKRKAPRLSLVPERPREPSRRRASESNGYHSPRPRLTPGARVSGRFVVQQRVAAGAMGEVWVGEHTAIRMSVALKVLLPAARESPELVTRFKREALLLGRMRSDHVARVLDFVVDERYGPVLVMEFVEGQSLADLLESRTLSVEEAIDFGIDVAVALKELHRANIVHRDIKPANVILQPVEHDRPRAVVVDFGLSRLVHAQPRGLTDGSITDVTRDDIAVGTMEYMAPEQILRSRDVTGTADLYALGALLYRAVSGRHLFGDLEGLPLARAKLAERPPDLDTGRTDPVARGFEAAVTRALDRDPAERYECADEMLADLWLLRDAARRASRAPAARRKDVEAPPRAESGASCRGWAADYPRLEVSETTSCRPPARLSRLSSIAKVAAAVLVGLSAAATLVAALSFGRSVPMKAMPAASILFAERGRLACRMSGADPQQAEPASLPIDLDEPPFVSLPPSAVPVTAAPMPAAKRQTLISAMERAVADRESQARREARVAAAAAASRNKSPPIP